MNEQKQIKELLEPLFKLFYKRFIPTSVEMFVQFHKQTLTLNVPDTVVEQLTDFYKVSNGVPNLDGFIFHGCKGKNLFECWVKKEEIWLGSRDNDILRWKNGQFCLGDANTLSYSADYEFPTLSGLLEKCFEKWYLGTWKIFMDSNNELDLRHDKKNASR